MKQEGKKTFRIAAIGRWMPVHKGHKEFLLKLVEKGYLVVMIGSCYDNGTERNCIPASEREKMLRAVFSHAGISDDRYEIVDLEDRHDFKLWIKDVIDLCKIKKITHFCTGNKEDIINELKGETFGMKFINPELSSSFPFHASDIRRALIDGNYDMVKEALPPEVLPILFQYSFKEIIACCENKGISFSSGEQLANFLLLLKNRKDERMYVLLASDLKNGMRELKIPEGPILPYETPLSAAVRILYEQTGIDVKVLDNSFEPAIARIENYSRELQQIRILGIYENSHKNNLGNSQCFVMIVEEDCDRICTILNVKGKSPYFESVMLALRKVEFDEHKKMIQKAIELEKSYPDLTRK